MEWEKILANYIFISNKGLASKIYKTHVTMEKTQTIQLKMGKRSE